jgi:predicted HD superfamily hydrolase involved in NAD metabolism
MRMGPQTADASSGLACPQGSICNRTVVLAWLKQSVPASRVQHILGVEAMASDLAQRHGVSPELAARAGLMHDLAKCFRPRDLLQRAKAAHLPLDGVLEGNPHLLHADIGALVAQEEFGEIHAEVLDAIRHHTLGQPGMSILSCVVFLADALEPSRGSSEDLAALRQLSQTNLYRAVWAVADASIRHLLDRPALIHPRTIQTRNWALQCSS